MVHTARPMTLHETLLLLLLRLYHVAAPADVVAALVSEARTTGADLALLTAVAMKETAAGTYEGQHLLTGAHIHRPCLPGETPRRGTRSARRPRGLCFNRTPSAQVRAVATTVGTCRSRLSCTGWLRGWRCGPNATCRATVGRVYAAEVWAYYDAIARALIVNADGGYCPAYPRPLARLRRR